MTPPSTIIPLSPMRRLGIRIGLSVLCLLGLGLLSGCRVDLEEPNVVDGDIDLTGRDLTVPLALNGTWLARSGVDSAAFAGYEYDASHWDTVAVPSYFEQQGYPKEGLVWYRMQLRLPAGAVVQGFADAPMNAGRLFGASPGRTPLQLGGNGIPDLTEEASRLSRETVTFEMPADTSVVLTWKVANHNYVAGGPTSSLVIGDAEVIEREVFMARAIAFVVVGIYLVLALTFLLHWIWNQANMASLTVSLLAITAAVRSLTVEGLLEPVFPELAFHTRIALEGATFFGLVALLYAAFWAFSPLEFLPMRIGRWRFSPPILNADIPLSRENLRPPRLPSDAWRMINTAGLMLTLAVSAACIVAICLVPLEIQSQIIEQYRWFGLFAAVMGSLLIVQIVYRRRRTAVGLVLGYGLMVLAGVHDIIVSQRIFFTGNPELVPASLVGFMLLQSFMVARRSARHAEFVRRHADILEEEVTRQTEELKSATTAAEEANDAKSRFLAAITHELRTPLNGIIGFADLLRDTMREKGLEEERHFADLIEISGRRLLSLVNDLLDLAKVESGRLTLNVDTVDLDKAVDEVVRQMHPFSTPKELTFETRIHASGLTVSADVDRLHQVLINLLSNAFKFTKKGVVAIEVDEAVFDDGRQAAEIRVNDTGPGIKPEFLPQLFDRFFQGDRNADIEGTGLGLAIAKELVDRMDGSLDVDSEVGRGTTFRVRLPIAHVSDEAPETTE